MPQKRFHHSGKIAESDYNNIKVISTMKTLTANNHFYCFNVFPVRWPQKSYVKAKISTMQPLFPDHLFVSYGYDCPEILSFGSDKIEIFSQALILVAAILICLISLLKFMWNLMFSLLPKIVKKAISYLALLKHLLLIVFKQWFCRIANLSINII